MPPPRSNGERATRDQQRQSDVSVQSSQRHDERVAGSRAVREWAWRVAGSGYPTRDKQPETMALLFVGTVHVGMGATIAGHYPIILCERPFWL